MKDTADDLNREDVEQIMRLVDDGALDYVQLETGGLRVVVARDGYQPRGEYAAPVEASAPDGPNGDGRAPSRAPAHVRSPVQTATRPPAESSAISPQPSSPGVAEGQHAVVAPMSGICYRRPDPASPPFVDVGTMVEAGDTVALIEVMKTFAAVQATVAGTVSRVMVDDSVEVVLGQPLLVIEQD